MTEQPKLNLIQFDALKTYPDAAEAIRKLLEMAEAGEVIGISACLVMKNRQTGTLLTEGCRDHIFLTIGALDYLKFRALKICDES